MFILIFKVPRDPSCSLHRWSV